MFCLYGNAPSIEKDPEIQALCSNVWSKIKEIGAQETPPTVVQNDIGFVSYEDAVKELLEMKKNGVF